MVLDKASVRPLAWCLYAIGLILLLAPILDVAAGIGSLKPGQVPWRFGAAGLLSGALVLPMLGLGLMLVASVLLGQRLMTRLLGIKAAALLVLVLGLIVVFALDALQVRAQVVQEGKRAFDLATLKALLTFGLEVLVLATLALNAFRAASGIPDRPPARKREGGELVVPRGEG